MNRFPRTRLISGDRAPGFALVVTLSLLILLSIIAVGLLGLSSVSLRSSSLGMAQAEAQANARLALMLAIGELQKSVGKDGNITAPSAIFDTNPDSPEPDSVKYPLLSGVWTARSETLGSTPDYDREKPFRRWLVSNSQSQLLEKTDFALFGSLTDPVLLANPTGNAPAQVNAGRVRTPKGAYAWWVGDENCKALLGARNLTDRQPSPSVADSLAGFATPGAHGIRAVDGLENFPSNSEQSDKVITRDLMELASSDGTPAAGYFHDLTADSESVLANVTDDSLRKDLNLYLEREDINWLAAGWGLQGGANGLPAGPLGPNDKIALSNPDQYDVLSWKSLHHWYNMHRRQIGTSNQLQLLSMRDYVAPDKVSNPDWNEGVLRVAPVVTRIQMVISFGVRKVGPSASDATKNDYDVYMYAYPVMTLWNPYSIPLDVPQWSVFLHTMPLEHTVLSRGIKVNLTGTGTKNGNFNWGWGGTTGTGGNIVMRLGDPYTPGITFAPGEAKTLTYSVSTKTDFFAHNMVTSFQPWVPPSPGNPNGHAGEGRLIGRITLGNPSDPIEIQTRPSSWNTSGAQYNNMQCTFDFRCETVSRHGFSANRWRQQMWTGCVGWRHETDQGNPASTFVSTSNLPTYTLRDLDYSAFPFIHLDVRLKTLDEVQLPNKTWAHNIPSHPYAASTSTSKHSTKGVDATTTFFAHPYNLTFEQITGLNGLIQNQAFFGPSNYPSGGGRSRIVSQEIPLVPLTSLAQLQNLPQVPIEGLNWSGHYFQNHAIGNSYASPGLPKTNIKESSFPFYLGQYFPWEGGDLAGRKYSNWTHFNNADYSISHAPASIIDRSYAANHLLFDGYFLSSMAAQTGNIFSRYGTKRPLRNVVQDFVNGTRPLPNPAYRLHLGGKSATALIDSLAPTQGGSSKDAHLRAAAHLMATGGFNVNSTSVRAWAAMLASAHLKRPITLAANGNLTENTKASFVVSRFNTPVGAAADNKPGAAAEDNRWLGYRELTKAEIGQLAQAMVKQVKKRGPFRSLGEFVNRRLTSDTDMALYGAVQAALEDPSVDINSNYRGNKITSADLSAMATAPNYKFREAALGPRYQGTPAYISQADILTPIAPIINVRSDTFLIRSCGESRSADGKSILARAWCEAVIQRVPDYIDPADEAFTPGASLKSPTNKEFGRRFIMKSFRWIPSSEIEKKGTA